MDALRAPSNPNRPRRRRKVSRSPAALAVPLEGGELDVGTGPERLWAPPRDPLLADLLRAIVEERAAVRATGSPG
jgi:hypothetical protein